jgi:Concanavalin A-like lectin/glucanases superfamily
MKPKRTMTKSIVGLMLVYYGFLLLLLPPMFSPSFLTLSKEPQTFGFEDDLSSVDTIGGRPMIVASPVAEGGKAVECQNDDYLRWNLSPVSRTLNISFTAYWTNFPQTPNAPFEALNFFEVHIHHGWDTQLAVLGFYRSSDGSKSAKIWTGVGSQSAFVDRATVYAIKTGTWHTNRFTMNTDTGEIKWYLDGTEVAAVVGNEGLSAYDIESFVIGSLPQNSTDAFKTYYDDITVSTLATSKPQPNSYAPKVGVEYGKLLVQVIGLCVIGCGVYVWWSRKKHNLGNDPLLTIERTEAFVPGSSFMGELARTTHM